MSNKIVQLENEAGDNIYPLAGGALTGSISKTMLEEGVFEGPELSEPSSVAYVATDNIQDGAVTSDKIDWTTLQYGVHTFSGSGWEQVQFDKPFTSAPVVIATANTGASQTSTAVFVKTANISATGFSVAMGTTSGYGSGNIYWLAFPPIA